MTYHVCPALSELLPELDFVLVAVAELLVAVAVTLAQNEVNQPCISTNSCELSVSASHASGQTVSLSVKKGCNVEY